MSCEVVKVVNIRKYREQIKIILKLMDKSDLLVSQIIMSKYDGGWGLKTNTLTRKQTTATSTE